MTSPQGSGTSAELTSNSEQPAEKAVIATLSDVSADADGIVDIEELNLEINSGEIVALLGPNASGRSLLLNLFLGLVQPSAGEVRVFGDDPEAFEVRERVGSTPYRTEFPGRLRVREIVEFVIAHYNRPYPIASYLELSELQHYADKKVSELSRTEERWFAVMLAFAGDPDLVFLDHPTRGMDLEWRIRLWQILREFSDRGGAVVVSTEVSEHVQIAADRAIVMLDGSIIAEASPAEIIDRVGRQCVAAPDGELEELEVTSGIRLENQLPVIPTSDPERTVRELVEQGVPEERLNISDSNLEHAVLQLIQRVRE